ncbi:hypothetical protein [Streptomyces nigrescens]|nr:hypothetical protein [Streptomyces libani]WAT94867.1 hypothetical protein STRLI_000539 [Streptomyces libani subsp. libani]
MTWRRLRVIIQGLPPESRTMTALRNAMPEEDLDEQAEQGKPEEGRWSQLEQLVAASCDRLARIEYVLICANTDKKSQRPDRPEPMRRPGAAPRRKKSTLSDASTQKLFELINGGAA